MPDNRNRRRPIQVKFFVDENGFKSNETNMIPGSCVTHYSMVRDPN